MHERVDTPLLVRRVAATTGHDVELVRAITDAVLEEITLALEAGDSVALRTFGTFSVRPEGRTWAFKFNPSQRLRRAFGWSST
jgi:DNA-binding protein HU-beta